MRILACLILVGVWCTAKGQTYYKDVQPIIHKNCLPCHIEGGAAPFEFNTYEDVSRKAKTIAEVIRIGYMPPWMPDTAYSHFKGERYLSVKEKTIILNWVKKGKKEGNSKRKESIGKLTEVEFKEDLRVSVGSIDVDTNVTDLYRFFVYPNPLGTDTAISGISFNPGNKKIVHHAWVFADTIGFSRHGTKTDAISEFSDLGFPFTDILTGYLPGSNTIYFPEDAGKELYSGSNIIVQVHYYSPNGKFQDASSVSLQFADQPVQRSVKTMLILEKNLVEPPLEIPANEVLMEVLERHVTDSIEILRIAPHMHQRGVKIKTYAITPEMDTVPLIKIDQWDFNWQGYYSFKEPVLVPAGSIIRQEATYDNSARNMNNPVVPPVNVTYGLGSLNEMCELAIEYLMYSTPEKKE